MAMAALITATANFIWVLGGGVRGGRVLWRLARAATAQLYQGATSRFTPTTVQSCRHPRTVTSTRRPQLAQVSRPAARRVHLNEMLAA